MKDLGRQFFLWHIVLCCLPLLLIYLSTFGVATVIDWLTGSPVVLILGCIIALMVYRGFRNPNDCKDDRCN